MRRRPCGGLPARSPIMPRQVGLAATFRWLHRGRDVAAPDRRAVQGKRLDQFGRRDQLDGLRLAFGWSAADVAPRAHAPHAGHDHRARDACCQARRAARYARRRSKHGVAAVRTDRTAPDSAIAGSLHADGSAGICGRWRQDPDSGATRGRLLFLAAVSSARLCLERAGVADHDVSDGRAAHPRRYAACSAANTRWRKPHGTIAHARKESEEELGGPATDHHAHSLASHRGCTPFPIRKFLSSDG